eukprot:COSAG01_NODE_12877_length_1671_cov_2.489822_1_plen_86_part_10
MRAGAVGRGSSNVVASSLKPPLSPGGTAPSQTPPAGGVRGDMHTNGALRGLHGGYSELGAGGCPGAAAGLARRRLGARSEGPPKGH